MSRSLRPAASGRFRRAGAVLLLAAMPLTMTACSSDEATDDADVVEEAPLEEEEED